LVKVELDEPDWERLESLRHEMQRDAPERVVSRADALREAIRRASDEGQGG
jgi:hypothetical protein